MNRTQIVPGNGTVTWTHESVLPLRVTSQSLSCRGQRRCRSGLLVQLESTGGQLPVAPRLRGSKPGFGPPGLPWLPAAGRTTRSSGLGRAWAGYGAPVGRGRLRAGVRVLIIMMPGPVPVMAARRRHRVGGSGGCCGCTSDSAVTGLPPPPLGLRAARRRLSS